MNIKNITLAFFSAVALLTSCNEIEEADRLIYVKPAEVKRAVLIEDFTGQGCVNCPTAINEIHKLQEQYGENNVIAVGIHSGPFSKIIGTKTYPLWTAEGDEYYNYWKVQGQPNGVINRASGVVNYPQWSALVYDYLQQTSTINLQAATTYNEETNTMNASVYIENLIGDYTGKLQLWLIEDGIVGVQYQPDGTKVNDYVHNHVFRTSVNGTWGEDISMKDGETKTITASYTLKEGWVAKNMSLVAFVYNEQGVQQAFKVKLIAE